MAMSHCASRPCRQSYPKSNLEPTPKSHRHSHDKAVSSQIQIDLSHYLLSSVPVRRRQTMTQRRDNLPDLLSTSGSFLLLCCPPQIHVSRSASTKMLPKLVLSPLRNRKAAVGPGEGGGGREEWQVGSLNWLLPIPVERIRPNRLIFYLG